MTEKVQKKVEAKVPEFQSVHGVLVHAFTAVRFEAGKPVAHAEDSWITCQVEAGKLVKV